VLFDPGQQVLDRVYPGILEYFQFGIGDGENNAQATGQDSQKSDGDCGFHKRISIKGFLKPLQT